MPQAEAGVEKPQPIVVRHDCRMAGVISHEKTCTYEGARATDKRMAGLEKSSPCGHGCRRDSGNGEQAAALQLEEREE